MSLLAIAIGLLVFLVLVGMTWATLGFIALLLHLVVAGIVGALADALVPGKLPWGWVGAVLAGLLGSWLGIALIGQVGPRIVGVPIIPGFVGAVILALVVSVLSKRKAGV